MDRTIALNVHRVGGSKERAAVYSTRVPYQSNFTRRNAGHWGGEPERT